MTTEEPDNLQLKRTEAEKRIAKAANTAQDAIFSILTNNKNRLSQNEIESVFHLLISSYFDLLNKKMGREIALARARQFVNTLQEFIRSET